ALRRFEAEGRQPGDLPLVQWAGETALLNIQQAFLGICLAVDRPFLGPFIRHVVAPLARLFPMGKGPSDELGTRVADILQRQGEQRERLTQGLFLEGKGIERLEKAFSTTLISQPILERIAAASREGQLPRGNPKDLLDEALAGFIIRPEEADAVLAAEAARRAALAVDTFSPDEYRRSGDPIQPPDPLGEEDPEFAELHLL
ncbi:MAG: DUF1974 domain-containing protein, partial [Acidobacteria bacterium]|nr:DUF1974 domain-containing protein [Acidobacteriota bacterium]